MRPDSHRVESVRATVGTLDGIEALRAVAVAWVVLFHWLVLREGAANDPWNAWLAGARAAEAIVRNGYLGVDLFFLISGLLLVMPWARAAAGEAPAPDPLAFYRRRIRRIVPAYYVQLAALFLVFAPLVLGVGYMREEAALMAYNAAAHAAFLHYTTPLSSSSLAVNGALWSLTLEAQFYLLLPLLAPAFVRWPARCAAAMAAAALAWRWLALNDLDALAQAQMGLGARWSVSEAGVRHLLLTQLPGYLAHFAAGMALGLATWRMRRRANGDRSGLAAFAALAAGVVGIAWLLGFGAAARLGPWGAWIATLAALAAITGALALGGRLVRALVAHRPVLFVGRVSYSIYLYHVPLVLLWTRGRVLDGSAWSLPLYLAVLLSIAALSYHGVEKRFMEPGKREPPPIIGG